MSNKKIKKIINTVDQLYKVLISLSKSRQRQNAAIKLLSITQVETNFQNSFPVCRKKT